MNFAEVLLAGPAAPEKVALLTQQGDVTYAELRREARRVADFLRRRGVEPGDRVLLIGESSPFWVEAYLGIALAGGVSVPVAAPPLPGFLASVVEATSPRLAFVQRKWRRHVHTERADCEVVIWDPTRRCKLDLDSVSESGPGVAGGARPDPAAPSDLAVIMFTSGSTAAPRGVMVSHGNILSNTADVIVSLDIGPDDRIMTVLPFYYCFGSSLLHSHLRAGATLVIDNQFPYPESVLRNLAATKCTSFAGVPSTYQILLRRSSLKRMQFPHLVKLQQAGGKLADPFIEELEEALPNARLYVMYGQTEATARLSCITPEDRRTHPGSVGRGLEHVDLQVVGESGRPVEPGEIGEIVAAGPNVTLGYWQDPEGTERVYGGGLHTGDLATVDEDGFIYIVDRARDFLKCGGQRVSCRQIEETLLRFPGMIEAAVIGMPDPVLGEAVCLFAVQGDGAARAGALKTYCDRELGHTLSPRRIICMDGLPHTSSGKPNKPALREVLASGNGLVGRPSDSSPLIDEGRVQAR